MIDAGFDEETGNVVLTQGSLHINLVPEDGDEELVMAAILSRQKAETPEPNRTDRVTLVQMLARESFAFSTSFEDVAGEECYKVSVNDAYFLFNPDGSLRYIAKEDDK